MDRFTYNLKLNDLITEFLSEGGDPAYCSDILRRVADEVFEAEDPHEEEPDTSAELC